jgi:hypothetical protein
MLKVRGEVPSNRMGHGMATAGGKLYIFGGFNDFSDGGLFVYNPALCTFTSVGKGAAMNPNPPYSTRVLFSFFGKDDSLYVFGGVRVYFGFYPGPWFSLFVGWKGKA